MAPSLDPPPSLAEAADLLERGDCTALELTDLLLARIDAFDGKLHSVISCDPVRAREAARTADRERAEGHVRGPLHGIPVGLKDICATADLPTHVGSVALSPFLPGEDCGVAARLREAGAIVFAKLATTEAAFMEHHESVTPPENPWHADYWTGVSSSGSGVATAAGLCLASFGTDTGGSIRFPALCCGIVGLKATWGRVSRHGVFPLAPSLDHIGPMTRTVRDAALLLEAVAGYDPKDPTSLSAPVPRYADALLRGAAGLRVGFDEAYCSAGVDTAIASALRDATRILAEAGAEIVSITLPETDAALGAFPVLVTCEASAAHRDTPPDRAHHYSPALAAAIKAGAATPAPDYARAHETRLAFAGALDRIFETIDVYLAPAWGRTTPTLDAYANSSDADLDALIRFTAPENLAGVPTLCLPAGLDDAGVPFGFQIVGRKMAEEAVLRAGATYERATGFPDRRPAL